MSLSLSQAKRKIESDNCHCSLTYIIDLVKPNSPARCKTGKNLTAGDKKQKLWRWKYFTLTLKPRYCLLSWDEKKDCWEEQNMMELYHTPVITDIEIEDLTASHLHDVMLIWYNDAKNLFFSWCIKSIEKPFAYILYLLL